MPTSAKTRKFRKFCKLQKNVEKENRKPRPAKGGEKRIGAFCLGGLHLVPEVLSQRGSSNVLRRRDAKRRNTRAFSSTYSIQHTPAFRKAFYAFRGYRRKKIKPAPPVAHPCRKGHTPFPNTTPQNPCNPPVEHSFVLDALKRDLSGFYARRINSSLPPPNSP